jgi:hypothetical protein
MFDGRVLDHTAGANTCEWTYEGIDYAAAPGDGNGTAYLAINDLRSFAHLHPAGDMAALIYPAAQVPFQQIVQHRAVRFQHIVLFTGIQPPPLEDIAAHFLMHIDHLLDGIGDLQLAPARRFDVLYGAMNVMRKEIDAYDGEIAFRLFGLLHQVLKGAMAIDLSYAEEPGVRNRLKQNERIILFLPELQDELFNAALDEVVTQKH